jgi:hypothetical protein
MQEGSGRRPYVWLLAVIVLLLLAAIPVAWASPLAQPGRSTIDQPETPTPFIVVDDQCVDPGQPVTKTVTIRNDRDTPMSNCSIWLNEVPGLEYFYEGQLVSPPYTFPIGTILPGQIRVFQVVIGITDDVEPCMDYFVDVHIQCDGESAVLIKNPVCTPCPWLPPVGD